MMLSRRAALALASASSLTGCGRKRASPPVAVHSVVGGPYQAGGVYEYPRAQYDYDRSGLAVVLSRHGPTATDGAPWSDDAMVAAHPTLQLPAVARVTNLETGREMLVRLDDRGPGVPGRLLGVSPRVAALLGPGSEAGVLRVRVRIDPDLSRAATSQTGGADPIAIAIATAPATGVVIEALAPPPGVGTRPDRSAATPVVASANRDATANVPLRLPEQVTVGAPRPGSLYVEAGTFSRPDYARLLVARLAGQGAALSTSYTADRDEAYRVRIGPLATAAQADAALDRARRAGVMGARIIVD